MSEELHREVHQEEDVVPARPVLLGLGFVLVFGAVLSVVSVVLLVVWQGAIRPSSEFPEQRLGAPHVVQGIRHRMFALRGAVPSPPAGLTAAARRSLDRWTFVDEKRGLVRMPIERAVELELHDKGTP